MSKNIKDYMGVSFENSSISAISRHFRAFSHLYLTLLLLRFHSVRLQTINLSTHIVSSKHFRENFATYAAAINYLTTIGQAYA